MSLARIENLAADRAVGDHSAFPDRAGRRRHRGELFAQAGDLRNADRVRGRSGMRGEEEQTVGQLSTWPGRRRRGRVGRSLADLAVGVLAVAALALPALAGGRPAISTVALTADASQLPAVGAPPGAAPLVSTSPYTPHRPASCPPLPQPNDPNTTSPGQSASQTGTFPWPPLPAGANPAKA